jgi:hypothetical protein
MDTQHKGAQNHTSAAEHHERAAHHYREAAKHHESGAHEKAGHHAHMAHGHATMQGIMQRKLVDITLRNTARKDSRCWCASSWRALGGRRP